jgi:hypothetical protein
VEEQFVAHPQALARLIATPDVVEQARQAYEKRTGSRAPDLAVVLAGVSAANEILADTAVRREVSPVINVSFQHEDRKVATEFLKAWMGTSVAHVGGLLQAEASRRLANLERLESELREAHRQKSSALSRAKVQRMAGMAEWETLLGTGTGSVPNIGAPTGHETPSTPAATAPLGLIPRLQMRSDMLRVQAMASPSPWTTSDVNRERNALELVLAEARTSSSLLQVALTRLDAEIETLESAIRGIQTELDRLLEAKSRLMVQVHGAKFDGNAGLMGDYPAGPELRVVAAPVEALERRTSRPPSFWALIASAVAGAVGLLLGLGLRRESPLAN